MTVNLFTELKTFISNIQSDGSYSIDAENLDKEIVLSLKVYVNEEKTIRVVKKVLFKVANSSSVQSEERTFTPAIRLFNGAYVVNYSNPKIRTQIRCNDPELTKCIERWIQDRTNQIGYHRNNQSVSF